LVDEAEWRRRQEKKEKENIKKGKKEKKRRNIRSGKGGRNWFLTSIVCIVILLSSLFLAKKFILKK